MLCCFVFLDQTSGSFFFRFCCSDGFPNSGAFYFLESGISYYPVLMSDISQMSDQLFENTCKPGNSQFHRKL